MIKNLKHNLGYGLPPVCIINDEEIKESFKHALDREMDNKKNRILNYGNICGDPDVLKDLSNWYTKKINAKVNPDNILLTNGSGSGLVITANALLKSGDNILFECPTYFLAANMYLDLGINLIPIKRQENGSFDFDEMEDKIKKHNIKAFYVVVPYHNPTGFNLKEKDRNIIYELANKYKFYVFSDDIYELLYYKEEGRQTPMYYCNSDIVNEKDSKSKREKLMNYDNNASPYIISINSFNKAVAPTFKFGFIQAHTDIIKKITFSGCFYVSLGVKSITEHMVRSYMELGYLDDSLKRHQDYIKTNLDIAVDLLKKCDLLSFDPPEGGYFMFVKLSDKVNIDMLNNKREEYELNFMDGYGFIPKSLQHEFPEFKSTIRLSVSFLTKDTIGDGIKAFISLVEECAKK